MRRDSRHANTNRGTDRQRVTDFGTNGHADDGADWYPRW